MKRISFRAYKYIVLVALFIVVTDTPLICKASELREFYNGARGLAMGDCGIGIVNDETALAINPAALGKLRNSYGTIFDPEFDIGNNLLDLYRAKAFSQPFALDSVAPTILQSPNTYYHARQQLFPSFVTKNFGIGIYQRYLLDAQVSTDTTTMETYYRDDLALLLGYNFRFFDGRIKIGFTGKLVSRIEMNEAALPTNIALDLPSLNTAGYMKEGVGAGADLGLVLTAPWTYLPSLAIVARNVGNMKYNSSFDVRLKGTTARPADELQDVDAAVTFSPIQNKNVRSVWTIEYRNILTSSTETDKAKLMHAGMEFNFGDVFFLRAGYNQRYWTAGFELSSERFQWQYTNYGEEVGTATANKEDRRHVLKFAFRF